MKLIIKVIFIFLFSTINLWSQNENNYVKHKVILGENVTSIAKKYKVTIHDIYKLNPESKNGIKENDILLINTNSISKPVNNSDLKNQSYTVKQGDTKYGLSKKFKVTIENLEKWNPSIAKDGLKEGQIIIIKTNSFIENEVKISNAPIKEEKTKVTEVSTPKNENKITIVNSKNNSEFQQYVVKSKETLFGIAKKFNVSQIKLLEINPELEKGVQEGMTINIPNESVLTEISYSNKSKLVPSNNNAEKTLVLFLPFNLNKMDADSTKTKSEFLRKDETLNIALDFYAGSLIAIDSLKKMGYNLKVKVFDTESNASNSVEKIIKNNNFSKVDAIIGPLYNNQIEQTALFVKEYNIPVISPLSKATGKPYSNIYYSMPSEEIQREMLFEYFKRNNGNPVAIFSKKRVKTKETLTSQFPDLKVVPLTEKGSVTTENITALLDSSKMNYVILDTESTGTILNVTGILSNLKSKYKIQLVVLELYEALDFEEIPIKRYTNLKMLFPSNTRNNTTGYYESFRKKFKLANNINPSKYATRGFDVTLDTVIRMYQENGFTNSTENYQSEQLESKFNYQKIEGGNYNTGIYLMHYTTDLTIEQAQ